MASSSKQRTTMAKLQRENKVRERRREKELRKDERKRAAAVERETPAEAPELTGEESSA